MLRPAVTIPGRVLLTLDAVGGVWSYTLDVARSLAEAGIECLLAGFGPAPTPAQRRACERLTRAELVWRDAPLDWMVADEVPLRAVTETLATVAANWRADLLHLNLPSQAVDLPTDFAIVVTSHSCVPTWWQAVRGDSLPDGWRWHWRRNRLGFDRADAVLVPTASHGAALRTVYGDLPSLRVIHNTARVPLYSVLPKEDFVLSAGRWWDTGKNGSVLDKAAANLTWPVVLAGQLEGPSGEHAHFQHARALGPLSPNHLVALMQRAALFAAPSVYEPFGLAVLEAALMGAALVLADIPSLHEIWHGAAVFVSPTDPAAWSQAIGGLADDPARRHDLTVLARSRAANFTPTRQKNEILAAYGAALASHAIRTARAA